MRTYFASKLANQSTIRLPFAMTRKIPNSSPSSSSMLLDGYQLPRYPRRFSTMPVRFGQPRPLYGSLGAGRLLDRLQSPLTRVRE